MANILDITSGDGFTFSAYRIEPTDKHQGTLILLQDVFGRTNHLMSTAASLASHGYDVWVPALLDRGQRSLVLPFNAVGIARGHTIADSVGYDKPLQDIQAVMSRAASKRGNVALLGYAWGGTLAYLAAARLRGVTAAVAYYGADIARFADQAAQAPTMMHFATMDRKISGNDIGFARFNNPKAKVHMYSARHGFASDERDEFFDANASKTAMQRSLEFIGEHMGASTAQVSSTAAPRPNKRGSKAAARG